VAQPFFKTPFLHNYMDLTRNYGWETYKNDKGTTFVRALGENR